MPDPMTLQQREMLEVAYFAGKLQFKFPDGVRGGRGKIQGEAKEPPTMSKELHEKLRSEGDAGMREIFRLHEEARKLRLAYPTNFDLLIQCGAKSVSQNVRRTHGYLLHCVSTDQDEELVARFKALTRSHFSVARYNAELEGWKKWDESPFQKFWNEKHR
jgi:hypothetical protein